MVKTFVPPGETNKLGIMVSACNIKIYCENVEMSILGLNAFCFIRESSLSIIIQSSCFLFLFQLLALIKLFVVLWLLSMKHGCVSGLGCGCGCGCGTRQFLKK